MNDALTLRQDKLQGNTDTSLLKILALFFMLIDHVGARILTGVTELRIIGRMAFPLYAWCLVVGSVKTRNPWKYALRLLLLAVISQPLYMLGLQHTWRELNILFTLTIGLLAIIGIREKFCFSQFWAPALCYLLLGYLQVDYGWKGLTFILVLYLARESRGGMIAAFLAYAMFWGTSSASVRTLFGWRLPFLDWEGVNQPLNALFRLQGMVWLSLPLIVIPMRTGIKMPKWLGYALYPLHLVLLIILRLLFGNATLASMASGFLMK